FVRQSMLQRDRDADHQKRQPDGVNEPELRNPSPAQRPPERPSPEPGDEHPRRRKSGQLHHKRNRERKYHGKRRDLNLRQTAVFQPEDETKKIIQDHQKWAADSPNYKRPQQVRPLHSGLRRRRRLRMKRRRALRTVRARPGRQRPPASRTKIDSRG